MGDAFGVCVVDCSVAEFRTGQFEDTEHLTLLETLLIQTKPKEVIYRRVRDTPSGTFHANT